MSFQRHRDAVDDHIWVAFDNHAIVMTLFGAGATTPYPRDGYTADREPTASFDYLAAVAGGIV